MKLVRVRLRNFRCYKDETTIDIDDVTAFIGKNDSGKSSILDAIGAFFDEVKVDQDDASKTGNKSDLRIICEFEDFPTSLIVDADYKTDLRNEYLLNEQGQLEIHKVYNGSLKTPTSKVYAHAVHPTADKFNDLLTLKKSELKKRAEELGVDLSNIDERINAQLRGAIWSKAGDLALAPQDIPLDAEGAKQLWEQLKKYLPVYALFKSDRKSTDQDDEAQDPMKAAVKEALKAQEDKLEEISDYVKKEVEAIAESTVEKIREMDPNLGSQLRPRFTPPTWANVFKISLTGDDEIPINKRGSGVRRLILLNFFRAKAEQKASGKEASGVIYAVEEPETSQHPNNQRMLMEAFAELAEQPDCQVILTTHTPALGRLLPVESLRYVDFNGAPNRKLLSGNEDTYRTVARALGVLPDHNVKLFIGVEGPHDINFLKTISKLLKQAGEQVPDLTNLDDVGSIIFIPQGGSNLIHWTSKLAALNIPEFHIFDRENKPPAKAKYQDQADEINNPDGNCKAVITSKREIENYLHPQAIQAAKRDVNITFGDFDDVPELAGKALGQNARTAKRWLNLHAVSNMTPDLLNESDPKGDIRSWLVQIQKMIES